MFQKQIISTSLDYMDTISAKHFVLAQIFQVLCKSRQQKGLLGICLPVFIRIPTTYAFARVRHNKLDNYTLSAIAIS